MRIVTQPRTWLFLAVMLVQFAVFEAGLRLEGGSEAAPAFQRLFMNDDRIGYRLKPGARTRYKTASFETDIVINSSGIRDDEIGPKAPDERRIVVLGDSLVMSVQVPLQQTFCKRLEDRLNRDPAVARYHYRVINAGVQGYGPVEEMLFYQHVASAFDADVVLMALFVGNDAIEAADGSARLHIASASAPKVRAARPVGDVRQAVTVALRRVVRRSMVLQIVRLRLTMLAQRVGWRGHAIERPLNVYLPQPPMEVTRGLEVTRECVRRVAEMASAHHAKAAVVLLPARFQVNDEDYANLLSAVKEEGETLLRNAATDRFKHALAGIPVPVMDALPVLFNVPNRADTFFADTVHLTPRGHDILAQALEAFLLDSRLIAAADVRQAAQRDR